MQVLFHKHVWLYSEYMPTLHWWIGASSVSPYVITIAWIIASGIILHHRSNSYELFTYCSLLIYFSIPGMGPKHAPKDTSLLQDAAKVTLRSETLRRNCVRCNNHKRWCKKTRKRCKLFAMEDASNTVQILVTCALQGIRFSSINCLWWGGTK